MKLVLMAGVMLQPAFLGLAQTPEALQNSGIARLDRYIEQFRKTGDLRTQAGEVRTAAMELENSYRGFAAASNHGQAAWSLVKAADCYRIATSSTPDKALSQAAMDRYRTAAELARKSGNYPALVKAMTGAALIAELESRDYGSAAAYAAAEPCVPRFRVRARRACWTL